MLIQLEIAKIEWKLMKIGEFLIGVGNCYVEMYIMTIKKCRFPEEVNGTINRIVHCKVEGKRC